MNCPVCGQAMCLYKEEPCYNKKTHTEYRRTRYRCEQDDTWGRLEVPVGITQLEDLQQHTPVVIQ